MLCLRGLLFCLLLQLRIIRTRHTARVIIVAAILEDLHAQRIENALLLVQRQIRVIAEPQRDQLIVQVGRRRLVLVVDAALDSYRGPAETTVNLSLQRRNAENLHPDGTILAIQGHRALWVVRGIEGTDGGTGARVGHDVHQRPVAQAHDSEIVGFARHDVLGYVAAIDRIARGDRLPFEIAGQARNRRRTRIGISHHQERHLLLQRQHVVVATGQRQGHQQRTGGDPPGTTLAAPGHVGHGDLVADCLGDRLLDLGAVACILLAEHGFFRTAETSMGATPLRQARGAARSMISTRSQLPLLASGSWADAVGVDPALCTTIWLPTMETETPCAA